MNKSKFANEINKTLFMLMLEGGNTISEKNLASLTKKLYDAETITKIIKESKKS
jgi:hypothetical protein